jgi:hypothetical protein
LGSNFLKKYTLQPVRMQYKKLLCLCTLQIMKKRISLLLLEARAFYPEYLHAHSDLTNRVLHFTGASLFYGCILAAVFTGNWWLLPVAIFAGYLLPGIGHHFFERNKSFRSTKPVLCVLCANQMYIDTLLFRMGKKLRPEKSNH